MKNKQNIKTLRGKDKMVYEKLAKIQNELKVPKGRKNMFGAFKYRSCEDVLKAVKPLLKKYNCLILITDKIIELNSRFYVEATATLVDCEDSTKVETQALAREEETKKGMDASQITGSASSYARKNALNGLLAIDDTKDADTEEPEPACTKEQVGKMRELGVIEENVCKRYKVDALEDLTKSQADWVIKTKERKIEQVEL